MIKFKTTAVCLCLLMIVAPCSVRAQDSGISGINVDEDFDVDPEYDDYEEFEVRDPYEKYNRWMFNINDKIYRRVFTPLSKFYDFMIPNKVQGSLNNFFRFINTPKRLFNNMFQKKFKASVIEFERLMINATVGLGGFFDPADRVFNLVQQSEDFGQTLGHYGVDGGPYIIWPIVGPSNRRDTIGFIGDTAFDVLFWLGIYDVEPEDVFLGIGIDKRVNNYSYNVRKNYERITESAVDPYIALQHAYLKNREKNIKE